MISNIRDAVRLPSSNFGWPQQAAGRQQRKHSPIISTQGVCSARNSNLISASRQSAPAINANTTTSAPTYTDSHLRPHSFGIADWCLAIASRRASLKLCRHRLAAVVIVVVVALELGKLQLSSRCANRGVSLKLRLPHTRNGFFHWKPAACTKLENDL